MTNTTDCLVEQAKPWSTTGCVQSSDYDTMKTISLIFWVINSFFLLANLRNLAYRIYREGLKFTVMWGESNGEINTLIVLHLLCCQVTWTNFFNGGRYNDLGFGMTTYDVGTALALILA